MKKTKQTKPLIAILGDPEQASAGLRSIIEEGPYRAVLYSELAALDAGLSNQYCIAAILDVDEMPLDNRVIRRLTLKYPDVSFFCISRSRFHPELKEAITRHLFACLTKPVDPDELHYFLSCVCAEDGGSRGPPQQ